MQSEQPKDKTKQQQTIKSDDEKDSSEDQFIGNYVQAPNYMKDNEHITHGYRIGFNSPKKILKSFFMLHNQSMNIWTHFCPAIIILCIISYLIWSFGSNQLLYKFQLGKQKLSDGISKYSQALNEYASLIKMKQFTSVEISQIQNGILKSYNDFLEGTEAWKNNTKLAIQDISHSLKHKALHKFQEIEKLKMQFQSVFVPYFMNQIIIKMQPEKVIMIKNKLEKLREQIDSDNYQYVQLLHRKHEELQANTVSRWPLFIFLFSAFTCLSCSVLFHLFYPMSGKAYQLFCRFDYAGINLLISGSAFPPLYYGMYCLPYLAAFYLTFIVLIGSTLFVVTLFEYLHRPENLVLKSLAYGGFGVSLIIPLSHAVINEVIYNNYGDNFSIIASVDQYFCCGASYLFGLYIYTVRCPERNNPGKYNICGHSHQIWHCFVVLGIIFTYFGALENLQTRRYSTCGIAQQII